MQLRTLILAQPDGNAGALQRSIAQVVKGKDDVLKTWPGIEAGNSIFVPHRVITKDNVEAFEAEVRKILGK